MTTRLTNEVVVYRATNVVNGKCYIGVTKRGMARREHEHRYSARTGSKYLFHRALRRYGDVNFVFEQIAAFEGDYDLAMVFEAEIVDKEKPAYNLVPGGLNRTGAISEATRGRMRAAQRGKPSPRKGKPAAASTIEKLRGQKRTEEQRARMSAAHKARNAPGPMLGKKHTEEALHKMRTAQVGRVGYWAGKKRPEASEWLSAANKGRPAWNKGVPLTDETKAKLSAANSGKNPPPETPLMRETRASNMVRAAKNRRQHIRCLNDGRVFIGQQAVADFYGVSKTSVTRVMAGQYPSVKGLRFVIEVTP